MPFVFVLLYKRPSRLETKGHLMPIDLESAYLQHSALGWYLSICYTGSMIFSQFDATVIKDVRRVAMPMARIALFIIFFWFGALKMMDMSPADPLVGALLEKTIPFVSFDYFRVFFGAYEMIIGISFLIAGMERVAIGLLIPHMAAAFLPLVVLPDIAWQSMLVPSFTGQYIIKNIVIIALALSIAAHLHPLNFKVKNS